MTALPAPASSTPTVTPTKAPARRRSRRPLPPIPAPTFASGPYGYLYQRPSKRSWATWLRMVEAEPRLQPFLTEALSYNDDETTDEFCAAVLWWSHANRNAMYSRLHALLLSRADHPLLGSDQAHEAAWEVLRKSLPPCRNCWDVKMANLLGIRLPRRPASWPRLTE